MTPKSRSIKGKLDRLDFIRIKSFCSAKDLVKRRKIQITDWEKIFVNPIFIKGLVSRKYKKPPKLKTTKNSVGKSAKDMLNILFKMRIYKWQINT